MVKQKILIDAYGDLRIYKLRLSFYLRVILKERIAWK